MGMFRPAGLLLFSENEMELVLDEPTQLAVSRVLSGKRAKPQAVMVGDRDVRWSTEDQINENVCTAGWGR
jgi:hypothetical protein